MAEREAKIRRLVDANIIGIFLDPISEERERRANSVPHPGNSGVGHLRTRAFDLWSKRDLCGVNLGKIGPMHGFIIEAARERGLHHHKVGRDIEVARRIK